MNEHSNVVDLGSYRFTKKDSGRFYGKPEDCQHKKLTLDQNGEIVTCDDCGKQVTAFWALMQMVGRWQEWVRNVNSRSTAVAEIEKRNVVLKAALIVEKAWRSRSMAPCCPHCNKAILPEDGFGRRGSVNREMEIARRKREQSSAEGSRNG